MNVKYEHKYALCVVRIKSNEYNVKGIAQLKKCLKGLRVTRRGKENVMFFQTLRHHFHSYGVRKWCYFLARKKNT